MKSSFSIANVSANTVFIIDNDNGGMSVTNDAENVVKFILNEFGNMRIVYKDTMGNWDELCHNGKSFTHYMGVQADDPVYDIIERLEE